LLDHGAQVSLVRGELLPKIQERNHCTFEECHARNCELERQPTGAGGQSLGTTAAVMLQVTTNEDSEPQQIPCYVLPSDRPIWCGELNDCAMVLGTNALEELGFFIVDRLGDKVKSDGQDAKLSGQGQETEVSHTEEASLTRGSANVVVRRLTLDQKCRIGPQQTCSVRVKVSNDRPTESVGIITPNEEVLATHQ